MTGYLCPVCGYTKLEFPPENHYICPCCGTEFGYEDFAETFEERARRWEELRVRWLDRDARWFSRATPPPLGWNPYQQVLNVGVSLSTDPRATSLPETEWELAVA